MKQLFFINIFITLKLIPLCKNTSIPAVMTMITASLRTLKRQERNMINPAKTSVNFGVLSPDHIPKTKAHRDHFRVDLSNFYKFSWHQIPNFWIYNEFSHYSIRCSSQYLVHSKKSRLTEINHARPSHWHWISKNMFLQLSRN